MPAEATALGEVTIDGVACKVFAETNATHAAHYYVDTVAGQLLRAEVNQTQPEQHVVHDCSRMIEGPPHIALPRSCGS